LTLNIYTIRQCAMEEVKKEVIPPVVSDIACNDANDRYQKSRRNMSGDKCLRVESRGAINILYTIGGHCNWNRGSSTVIMSAWGRISFRWFASLKTRPMGDETFSSRCSRIVNVRLWTRLDKTDGNDACMHLTRNLCEHRRRRGNSVPDEQTCDK